MHIRLLILLFVALWPTTALRAQQSPHGPLPTGLDCAACHTNRAWTPLRETLAFDHDTQTRFPLTGRHEDAGCASCHLDLRFDEPRLSLDDCASCHVDVHLGAFAEPCTACHNTTSFQDVDGLAVHLRTSFPLTGAHAQIACESCHADDRGGAFTTLDTDCYACHEQDYEATTATLDHVALGFPTDCEQCHSTLAWPDAYFEHATVSGGFALVGAHATARCASCHVLPGMAVRFDAASEDDCYACHAPDHEREHGAGFPTTCQDCHTVETWEGAEFDHAATANGFALVGAHQPLNCASCHVIPGYDLLFHPAGQDDCYTCHEPDYQDEHGGSGFPTTCLDCHNVETWDDAEFDHAAASNGFALVGAHATASCESCHVIPGYDLRFEVTTQDDCYACHAADYEDEHAGSGFPTTCQDCHGVDTWEGAEFDHALAANGFALVGAHEPLACASCHVVPGYDLLFHPSGQDDCYTCHEPDYQGEHAGTGFPTTCLDCHTVETWDGAEFDHDGLYFPIYSGTHRGEWSECQDCHNAPADFSAFTCLDCHAHRQSEMDGEHDDVRGYVYESTACYSCHPNGREEDDD